MMTASTSSVLQRKAVVLSKFLCRLQQAVQLREGQDAFLLFMGETSRLLAVLLELLKESLSKIHHISRLSSQSAWIKALSPAIVKAAGRFQTLAGFLDEWQMINRMFGLLDVLVGTGKFLREVRRRKKENLAIGRKDIVLEGLQHLSMIFFHFSEGAACLASKKILTLPSKRQNQLSFAAVRAWAVFTFLDLARGVIEYKKMTTRGDVRSPKEQKEGGQDMQQWRSQFFINLAWAPVTVHWGVDGGLLPDSLASLLAVYATSGIFKDVWKRTI
ncbi:unnamed protein product [Clonostachys chloroleuca]|uniref:Uncharacterized protein n=1 Tax=Clonostachys chloroleuca TaxID=1926264 RepID=A0AA35LYD6_9HYPO|nr:unnamed protein product [Clonostachys chloroleuca]